jgi:hypothetical protein
MNFLLLMKAWGAVVFTQLAVSLLGIWFVPSRDTWTSSDYGLVLFTQLFTALAAAWFWRGILPKNCGKRWPSIFAECVLLFILLGFVAFQIGRRI